MKENDEQQTIKESTFIQIKRMSELNIQIKALRKELEKAEQELRRLYLEMTVLPE